MLIRYLEFCNECGWSEEVDELKFEFCPECGHVNIGYSKLSGKVFFNLIAQVRYKDSDELSQYGFGDHSRDRELMRQKYPNINLSFQSSSNVNKNEYLLNVYERSN